MNSRSTISALVLFILCIFKTDVYAQDYFTPATFNSPLSDPQIPNGEVSRYISRVDNGETSYSSIRIEHQSEYYIMQRNLPNRTEVTRLSKATLVPLSEETQIFADSYVYNEVRKLERIPRQQEYNSANAFITLSVENVPYVLRGYPFNDPRDIQVKILSANSSSSTEADGGADSDPGPEVSISAVYRGIEEIEVNGRMQRAHKLELVLTLPGVAAIFSGAVPKTFFWYEIRKPHKVLKLQGTDEFSFGGDPPRIITTELLSSQVIN